MQHSAVQFTEFSTIELLVKNTPLTNPDSVLAEAESCPVSYTVQCALFSV